MGRELHQERPLYYMVQSNFAKVHGGPWDWKYCVEE